MNLGEELDTAVHKRYIVGVSPLTLSKDRHMRASKLDDRRKSGFGTGKPDPEPRPGTPQFGARAEFRRQAIINRAASYKYKSTVHFVDQFTRERDEK